MHRGNGSDVASLQVMHDRVAGRVRFRHPGLVAQTERVRAVEAALAECRGVISVRASALTGSVLVEYGPPATIPDLASMMSWPGVRRIPNEGHGRRTRFLPPSPSTVRLHHARGTP